MHLIRVLRPINLAIIVFTMLGAAYYIHSTNSFQFVHFHAFDFSLLIFSTILIAAAGNIINDYFDIKADRINKPDSLIIGKYIKKRWAILLHWIFNGVAVAISIYLSVKYKSLWFIFIHVVSGNLLWYYSLILKKKILSGNIVIAIMTGIIPLLTVLFFKVSNESNSVFSPYHAETWSVFINYNLIYLVAICAFFLNLSREIIKDIQDVKGDKEIQVKSLPMVIGEQKAYWLAAVIAQLSWICCLVAFLFFKASFTNNPIIWLILLISAGLNLFLFLFPFIQTLTMKHCSLLIKLTLFIGICALYFS
jgi:4-hydroxybenzoate polyprenyltransferase